MVDVSIDEAHIGGDAARCPACTMMFAPRRRQDRIHEIGAVMSVRGARSRCRGGELELARSVDAMRSRPQHLPLATRSCGR